MKVLTIATPNLEKIADEIKGKESNVIQSYDYPNLKYPLNKLIFTSGFEYNEISPGKAGESYQLSATFEFLNARGFDLPPTTLPDEFSSYALMPCIFLHYKDKDMNGTYRMSRKKDEFQIITDKKLIIPLDTENDKLIFTQHLKNLITITEAAINHNYLKCKFALDKEPYTIHVMPRGHSVDTGDKDIKLITNPNNVQGRGR